MIKKTTSTKNLFLITVLFLVIINIVFAQSIGATPRKTIRTEINKPLSTYFGVSQGAEYAEKITIEEDYDWLTIEDKEFILESKTRKTIKADIYIEKRGTYEASIRICGSQISTGGEVLSTEACVRHKLKVIAVWDTATKVKYAIGVVVFLALVVGFSIYFFRKDLKKRKRKK